MLKNKGFSLVELMVAIAIIGILAAIAVPNFARYSARSKQSEAKAELSSIYTAERAFQSEWQLFIASFEVIGYAPFGQLRYDHGFSTENPTALPSNYNGPAKTANINASTYCTALATCSIINAPYAPPVPPAAALATNSTFTAHASADISGNALQDQWSINELKVLSNIQNGLP